MSDQPQSDASSPDNLAKNVRDAASDAFAKASDMARDTSAKAKRAASETASSVTQNVRDAIDQQLGTGADMAGHFAHAMRLAADDLNREAPMLAGLVYGFANTVESHADRLQQQTVDQLLRSASDLTRRQPALVFGLAALAGFFAFRTLKSTPGIVSPPIQPTHNPDAVDRPHG